MAHAPNARPTAEETPFRSLLKFQDRLQYITWTLLGRRSTFQCQFRDGLVLSLRPKPSNDWDTAYEIFRLRVYDSNLERTSVRRIVDLGGNVGLSLLFWCSNYPNARVLTYEPHPHHCELMQWHLARNGYADRVRLIQAAAAVRASRATLVDDDIRSRLVVGDDSKSQCHPLIEVATVDFFETVGSDPVDILKVDIEGGEYELLQDRRFDDVASRTQCLVMEWHKRAPQHLGSEWCKKRLSRLGFNVTEPAGSPLPDVGMLHATRIKFDA